MSFGAPGGGSVNYKPSPPERGSFPLDHEGMLTTNLLPPFAIYIPKSAANRLADYIGECKHIISGYLKCIKLNRGTNDEACRKLAKDYLACRMDKNLMAPDDFKNLGLIFKDDQEKKQAPTAANTTDASQGTEKN
ncbi:hypothetical protein N7520_000721 [Penicillium odoratum]|uniref:uncharacterized protein n=1 Tax=Penicillium odoratum TaxID=1167516 RepID=UPI002546EF0B|nr:uncharacterized protein N7520_000721 [Penicillium odoratum]KAJ5777475.1 hypothetical protein N7520_000721 [Penicillium odoratum]